MATKKDLVEAYAFSRRRLVTAFLSGAPGGREVEPSRPGRTIVGGLALSVLLIAGAAIASVLASRTEEDWNQIGLVVSRQQAAPYVILEKSSEPQLIPVINITSAQLILGADLEPTYVDQDVIEDQTPGEPIGIAGAPQTLPRPQQFIETGWTACTDDGRGIAVTVSEDPHVTVPERGGIVVQSEGRFYVIAKSSADYDLDQARAHRYLLPQSETNDLLLGALGLQSEVDAPTVPQEWLGLFPEGAELSLASFAVDGFGEPLDNPDLPAGAKVGDYVVDPSGDGGAYFTADGKAVPLDAFALQVYANSPVPGRPDAVPEELQTERPPIPSATLPYRDAHWPSTTLEEVRGQVCARLDARHADVPLVDLAGDPDDTAAVGEDVDPGLKRVDIDRGRGAFVRVGDWDETTSSSAYVIDPRGQSYALVGGDTVAKLGYDGTEESFVPDSWLKLFSQGVALSTSLALCPPAGPGEDAVAAASPTPTPSPTEPGASAGPVDNGAPVGCQQQPEAP